MTKWIAGVLLFGMCMVSAVPASAESGWRLKECRFQYHDGHKGWSVVETKATIRCAAGKFGVSLTTARYVAERESRFHALAYNRYGCGGYGCLGVYQHHAAYWSSRVGVVPDWLKPIDHSAFDGRTNVLVTMSMVKNGGWDPWM